MGCDALTVDSNGNALSQLEAIGASESWDLIERVDLDQVCFAGAWVGLDDFDIKVVRLCDNCTSDCARVFLERDVTTPVRQLNETNLRIAREADLRPTGRP